MKNSNTVRIISRILFILLFVAAIALIGYLIAKINRTFDQALQPFRDSNSQLNTQVAQLLHPTPTILPDPVTMVHEVQSLSRLETIRYSLEKVITAEINHGILDPLLGDKLLFVAHGYVIAGIDMGKIQADDLTLQGDTLTVRLPEAEVFVASLDNNQSYVYSRETGIFARPDPTLETQARQVAEEEIRQAAIEDGILDNAASNAQVYLHWFFETLGYGQVVFIPSLPQ